MTQEHKGLLVVLARETGNPIPALIAEALEGLQEHMHPDSAHDTTRERHEVRAGSPSPPAARKPIWEQCIEAFQDIPAEELERLPATGLLSMTLNVCSGPQTAATESH